MLPSAARIQSGLVQIGRFAIGTCAVSVLLSCASVKSPVDKDITPEISKEGLMLPGILREREKVESGEGRHSLPSGEQDQNPAARTTEFKTTPSVTTGKTQVVGEKAGGQFDHLTGNPVEVNLSGLAIAAFIDEVFGNILKLSYEIDSALQQKTDLVTLRVEGGQEPAALAKLAVQVLARYGVDTTTVGGMTRFSLSTNPQGGEPPLLISGTALPEVPASHRTVFQYVPIKVVDARYAQRWLLMAYEGLGVKVDFDADSNSLVLMGPQPKVQQLAEAVKLFDQPAFQGQNSISIAPVYLTVKELEAQLAQVLDAQGFKVSRGARGGSVILVPLEAAHKVIVFAADRNALAHAKAWAAELDQAPFTADSAGLFVYKMQNTQADDVASVLNQLYGGGSGSTGTSTSDQGSATNSGVGAFRNTPTRSAEAAGNPANSDISGSSTTQFVVDKVRNAIIYKGSAAEWARLLIIIKEMDIPPKQVLIQVTIAEVTLSDNFGLGLEGFVQEIGLKGRRATFSTEGGLGDLPASGLFTFVNNAGDVRARLSAYAGESRVRLISTPSVLVKSGAAATVNVSTQFSVVTGDTVSDEVTNGSSGSRQSYSYIEAGTVLSVTPTIHAGNRVELEISQEVSEPGAVDGSGNPPISTRSVQTVLSLKDGGSVLLGGLIRTKRSDGETSVPVLGKIPLLGHLFRANSDNKERTELLIMVVPYVLNDSDEAESITKQFRENLSIEGITDVRDQ
jgi:general secretion pathway protein D